MLSFLPGFVCGILSTLFYFFNTVFWSMPVFFIASLKFVTPSKGFKRFWNRILNFLAEGWISVNGFIQKLFYKISWDISGTDRLSNHSWYMVVANHQSWVDVLVLQSIFNHRIPFLKFFIKSELKWIPLLGMAWWALDFPFMKRYSPSFLKKHPELKGKDMEATRKACAKFETIPISVMNFIEGTRFDKSKHHNQKSPYSNLLKPKAGGLAFVFSAMGNKITSLLDVTIVYPDGKKTYWDFACGRISKIIVHVKPLPISKDLIGNYAVDREFRTHFQEWLNELWHEKDILISAILSKKGVKTPL